MKISYGSFGRNKWLRINGRYFGFVPAGIYNRYGIKTRKAGRFVLQDTEKRIGYHVYAGMIIGAVVLIKLALLLVGILIERGM